mmetsp:Transcript_8241/g.27392  ORF Transcript_8241/g.27392 Transcript_8241/m.27392 type:complete len:210 (-) Transcript_8241:248-877(-)
MSISLRSSAARRIRPAEKGRKMNAPKMMAMKTSTVTAFSPSSITGPRRPMSSSNDSSCSSNSSCTTSAAAGGACGSRTNPCGAACTPCTILSSASGSARCSSATAGAARGIRSPPAIAGQRNRFTWTASPPSCNVAALKKTKTTPAERKVPCTQSAVTISTVSLFGSSRVDSCAHSRTKHRRHIQHAVSGTNANHTITTRRNLRQKLMY